MLRIVLVFLAGVLVGANAMYYVIGRLKADAPAPPVAAVVEQPVLQESAVATPVPAAAPLSTAAPPATVVPAAPGPAGLVVPVHGLTAAQLSDTYSDTRSEGRTHEAIDIIAPRGTPVLAVADGKVEKLFDSKPGGLTIYQFEPSGKFAYYYAHLDRYAPGLAEGKALRQGEVIGYVGSTGNADQAAPHLHFAVFVLGPERSWWQGTAINPYPLLGGR